jgi:hypothetical protein
MAGYIGTQAVSVNTTSATISDDLAVGDDATIAGTLGVTGVLTATSLDISGAIDVDGLTNLDVVDIDGAVDMASTLAVAGVVTANAGVVVDNFTLDGTTLALSSGDLTVDVAGDIILDAGGQQIILKDDGTTFAEVYQASNNLYIESKVSDKDIFFRGNDGGSDITALTLDMSAAGAATFNDSVTADFLIVGGTAKVSTGQTNMFQAGEGGNFFHIQRNEVQDVLEVNTKANTATGRSHFVFNNSNGSVGTIQTANSATSYNTSSDYRLKENVDYDWDATTRLKQLKPARFNFIVDADTTVDGFLAHEAQAIVPECVTGAKDEVKVWQNGEELPDGVSVGDNKLDTDGNTIPKMQGIDQSKLVPLLVKTIQELEARITALEG